MGIQIQANFRRRIVNPDMASCWLKSCFQLILTAFDHSGNDIDLFSELGKELQKIQKLSLIDPSNTKDIIVFTEDTRIALRKSQIMSQIQDRA